MALYLSKCPIYPYFIYERKIFKVHKKITMLKKAGINSVKLFIFPPEKSKQNEGEGNLFF